MFVVPGPQPWLPAPGVPRGAIARHAFHSAVSNDDRDFFVYTPAGYDPRRAQPYPVIFLLHGLRDDAERWMNTGGSNVVLDNLIAQRKAVPMVMVTTLGYGVNNGPAGAMAPENITDYTRILLDEVLPLVEKSDNVSRNREQRAIAGLSMGGAETLYTGGARYFRASPAVQLSTPTSGDVLRGTSGDISRNRWPSIDGE